MNKSYLLYCLLLLHVLIQSQHLFLDFWNDEIYSLKEFSLVSLSKTLTDYHSTNNHIFFNLINNIYCSLLGINTLKDTFDSPWVLRIIPLTYSILTIVFVYKTAEKYILENSGTVSALILITTIPFYNFALQLRGYGLSIMLFSILSYLIFSYLNKVSIIKLIMISAITLMLFYTLTINLLLIIPILFLLFTAFLLSLKRNIKNYLYLHVILSILTGLISAIICYYPILKDVFSDSFAEPSTSRFPFNLRLINVVFLSFISKQYQLILLATIGFFLLFREKKNNIKLLMILTSSVCIMILPFAIAIILSVLMGQRSFERIFITQIPFYSILIGVLVTFLMKRVKFKLVYQHLILFISVLFVFNTQLNRINNHLAKEKIRGQGLYFNYYLSHFHPRKCIKTLLNSTTKIHVIDGEEFGILEYLKAYKFNYTYQNSLKNIIEKKENNIILITSYPTRIIKEIKELNPSIRCTVLNEKESYNSFIKIEN